MSDSSKGSANRTPAPDERKVPRRGRLLGLDYGTRRVGLAISDEEQRLAVPLETYSRRKPDDDARHLVAVVGDYRIVGLVIGLPLHMGGEEGQKAGEARRFGAWAGGAAGLPFAFWDERLSTAQADEHLAAANLRPNKRKLLRDKIAAQIMLQSYLESRGQSSR
jgi:putative Holliday junction resolvase